MGKIKFDSVKIIWKMFISFKKKIYIYILILTTYTIILFFKKNII